MKFKKTAKRPQILIFGEMGNGKSTTGNFLIRDTLSYLKKRPTKKLQFEAQKSLNAVTKSVNKLVFDNIVYIDTPGFNDPDKTRSDNQIFSDIVDELSDILGKYGVATVL